MKLKGEVVFLKESKSFDPGRIGEIIVVSWLGILWLVWVIVEQVTDTTETTGLAVALEYVLQVT